MVVQAHAGDETLYKCSVSNTNLCDRALTTNAVRPANDKQTRCSVIHETFTKMPSKIYTTEILSGGGIRRKIPPSPLPFDLVQCRCTTHTGCLGQRIHPLRKGGGCLHWVLPQIYEQTMSYRQKLHGRPATDIQSYEQGTRFELSNASDETLAYRRLNRTYVLYCRGQKDLHDALLQGQDLYTRTTVNYSRISEGESGREVYSPRIKRSQLRTGHNPELPFT